MVTFTGMVVWYKHDWEKRMTENWKTSLSAAQAGMMKTREDLKRCCAMLEAPAGEGAENALVLLTVEDIWDCHQKTLQKMGSLIGILEDHGIL